MTLRNILFICLILLPGRLYAQNKPLPELNLFEPKYAAKPAPQAAPVKKDSTPPAPLPDVNVLAPLSKDIPPEVKHIETVYVNTDRLILRSDPTNKYYVIGVFYTPAKLELDDTSIAYFNQYKNVPGAENFYAVSFTYRTGYDGYTVASGYGEKKSVVSTYREITSGIDITRRVHYEPTPLEADGYPNPKNRFQFSYPYYKGGDHSIIAQQPVATPKRVYHTGPHGGCYYINSSGLHIYVDKRFCK